MVMVINRFCVYLVLAVAGFIAARWQVEETERKRNSGDHRDDSYTTNE